VQSAAANSTVLSFLLGPQQPQQQPTGADVV